MYDYKNYTCTHMHLYFGVHIGIYLAYVLLEIILV